MPVEEGGREREKAREYVIRAIEGCAPKPRHGAMPGVPGGVCPPSVRSQAGLIGPVDWPEPLKQNEAPSGAGTGTCLLPVTVY